MGFGGGLLVGVFGVGAVRGPPLLLYAQDSCPFLRMFAPSRRGYPVFDPSAPLSVLYRTILSQSILALKRPSIGKPFHQTSIGKPFHQTSGGD